MAISPPHRLGQMIGDLLEEAIAARLDDFCKARGLYLDKKGARKPARRGKKISWKDKYGNSHDLDFVIEKDGTKTTLGQPLAFIEVAWRRYAKHSKNKAQEIQGAILPIAEKYSHDKPFLGGVLAGVFTNPSLNQMRSSGFTVALFRYETVIKAFHRVGIDAAFNEKTKDAECQHIIDQIESLNDSQKDKVKKHLLKINSREITTFFKELEASLRRRIEKIIIIPCYGEPDEFASVGDAKQFIMDYLPRNTKMRVYKFEIFVEYNNGDKIDASFKEKKGVIDFLEYIDRN